MKTQELINSLAQIRDADSQPLFLEKELIDALKPFGPSISESDYLTFVNRLLRDTANRNRLTKRAFDLSIPLEGVVSLDFINEAQDTHFVFRKVNATFSVKPELGHNDKVVSHYVSTVRFTMSPSNEMFAFVREFDSMRQRLIQADSTNPAESMKVYQKMLYNCEVYGLTPGIRMRHGIFEFNPETNEVTYRPRDTYWLI